MPGDITTAAIQRTRLDPVRTFDQIIERDDISDACVRYLVQNDVPCFVNAIRQQAYAHALEEQLRAGAVPEQAREAALRKVGGGMRAAGMLLRHAKVPGARQLQKPTVKQAAT
jgi:hypothetical protein